MGRHARRALLAGAALAFGVAIACADNTGSQKGSRPRSEVTKPAPHDGQLAAPRLSDDWWLRIRQDASFGKDAAGSTQVFVHKQTGP